MIRERQPRLTLFAMGDAAETRAALELVCETLRRKVKISYIDAECLRRAKHDDEQVRPEMWALIIDLLEIQDLPESRPLKGFVQPLPQCKDMQGGTQNDHGLGFKHAAIYSLSVLGYPRADKLFTAVDPDPVETDRSDKWNKRNTSLRTQKVQKALASCSWRLHFFWKKWICSQTLKASCHHIHRTFRVFQTWVPKMINSLDPMQTRNAFTLYFQVHSKWQNEIRRLQQTRGASLGRFEKITGFGQPKPCECEGRSQN